MLLLINVTVSFVASTFSRHFKIHDPCLNFFTTALSTSNQLFVPRDPFLQPSRLLTVRSSPGAYTTTLTRFLSGASTLWVARRYCGSCQPGCPSLSLKMSTVLSLTTHSGTLVRSLAGKLLLLLLPSLLE